MMNIKKYIQKHFYLIIMLLVLVLLVLLHLDLLKSREGFDISEISKIGDSVKDATNTISRLPSTVNDISNTLNNNINSATSGLDTKLTGQINSATSKLDQQIKSGINDLRAEMQQYVVNKLISVFTQIGNMLKAGIIDPLTFMFVGLGNVFTQIFNIIKMIGDKIISLPSCIMTYIFQGILNSIYGIYMFILPELITTPLNALYRNSLGILVNWISDTTGYTASYDKCYKFNVNDEVDKMTQEFNQIGQKFNNDFGKIDFSKIKV